MRSSQDIKPKNEAAPPVPEEKTPKAGEGWKCGKGLKCGKPYPPREKK